MSDDEDDGDVLATQGMKLAADAQARKDAEWFDAALAAIKSLAEDMQYFDANDLWERDPPKPQNPKAWGSVWRRAAREGYMVTTWDEPWRKSNRPSDHSKWIPRYRSLIASDF